MDTTGTSSMSIPTTQVIMSQPGMTQSLPVGMSMTQPVQVSLNQPMQVGMTQAMQVGMTQAMQVGMTQPLQVNISSQPSATTPKSVSLADTIKSCQAKLAQLGPGPHAGPQKEEYDRVNQLLLKAQAALSGSASMGSGSSGASAGHGGQSGGQQSRSHGVLDRQRLQELVKEVDPLEQLDEDVEEVLMQLADDFIDNLVTASCQFAKHRKANTVEVKDVQLHLEKNWDIWVPGYGSDDFRPIKKSCTTEAHKQRMALIKKTLKKT